MDVNGRTITCSYNSMRKVYQVTDQEGYSEYTGDERGNILFGIQLTTFLEEFLRGWKIVRQRIPIKIQDRSFFICPKTQYCIRNIELLLLRYKKNK